jgi:regulator of Ty1 transposition protein 109
MGIETLKDSLLRSLIHLPDSRTFHIYTLISEPVRDQDVFLYAAHRPKAYVRHVLVLLAQHPPQNMSERVFVCAIEAFLYTIPSSNSSILYISKVDSTGQGRHLRPNPTRTLVVAFLQHFITLATRPTENIWIHVFARAQNQYLFPNSAEYAGKRVLRDVSLCKWWKEALERAIQATEESSVGLYYLLPGYSAFEAKAMLYKFVTPTASDAYPWVYSHPYNQTIAPWPCGAAPAEDLQCSIAQLIPSLPDDPKARFLDEIASTPSESPDSRPALPTSPRPPKRIRTGSATMPPKEPALDSGQRQVSPVEPNAPTADRAGKNKAVSVTPGAQRALASVPMDEFWERMAFRQECSQGAVTGYFTAIFVSSSNGSTGVQAADAAIPGQQPTAVLERVISTLLNLDFGSTEHAIRATKVIENSIRAMCGVGAQTDNPSASEIEPAGNAADFRFAAGSSSKTELLERANDLSVAESVSTERKRKHPESESLILSQIDEEDDTAAPLRTRGPSRDDNNNHDPLAEPGAFASFVYGNVTVENPPLPADPPPLSAVNGAQAGGLSAGAGGEPIVTILQVRKKKRPAASSQ